MENSIPSINMILAEYKLIAETERLRMKRPSALTVRNTLQGVRRICEIGAIDLSAPINLLTTKRLQRIADLAATQNVKPITLWTYLSALQALCADWTHRYYRERNWRIPSFELPVFYRAPRRYVRPDSFTLQRVKQWYGSLAVRPSLNDWAFATLMLEFAMRNGDVARLTWANFHTRDDGTTILCYTPHKTALTSARTVAWPVHPAIWEKFDALRQTRPTSSHVIDHINSVTKRLNHELRTQEIFTGSKGCYELRKICIDHIYQKFGAEVASAISGDDIRTITRYYADPSAVTVKNIRIIDLI